MGAWVTKNGRTVWDPNGTRSDEEWAAADAHVREVAAHGRAGAAVLWKPESTVATLGREVDSKAKYEAILKKNNLVEISAKDAARARPQVTKREDPKVAIKQAAKSALDEAEAFLRDSGQYVEPGTPTTEATKANLAAGKPIIRAAPESKGPRPSKEAPPPVNEQARPGIPWGYAGDKGDFVRRAAQRIRIEGADRLG